MTSLTVSWLLVIFELLKEFWTIFVHRFSYKVFERAEIARC